MPRQHAALLQSAFSFSCPGVPPQLNRVLLCRYVAQTTFTHSASTSVDRLWKLAGLHGGTSEWMFSQWEAHLWKNRADAWQTVTLSIKKLSASPARHALPGVGGENIDCHKVRYQ